MRRPRLPQRRALVPWEPSPAWLAAHPKPEPVTHPISDQGPSWRQRCDRAPADDSGTDAADD
jgi:hypothetical protein